MAMTDTAVVHLGLQVMTITFELAAPVLITALAVGFLVSLIQSATQIQEFTLSFVPKVLEFFKDKLPPEVLEKIEGLVPGLSEVAGPTKV